MKPGRVGRVGRVGRTLVALAFVAALGRAGVAACVIDLDPVGVAQPDGAIDGGFDSSSLSVADAGDAEAVPECKVATDCVVGAGAGSGCVTPSCNAGRCAFSFCAASKCGVSHCDTSSGAGACTAEQDAGFVGAQLGAIPLGTGCRDVARCIAVSHPLVFVAGGPQEQPVTAYNVGDLLQPVPITVTGLAMDPQFVVASGRRVYFVATPSIIGASFAITIGWVELPSNPYVATLPAQQVDVPFTGGGTLAGVFPAPRGGLFIAATGGQVGRVNAGSEDAAVSSSRPGDVATTARFLAESGEELAFGFLNTASSVGLVSAGLLFNPGATSSSAPPLVGAGPLGRVPTAQIFGAPGPDGSVIATLAVGDHDAAVAASAAVVNVRSVKLVRLVAPGGKAVTFGPSVDLAVYQAPATDSGALTVATRAAAAPAVVGDDILAISHIKSGGTLAQGVSMAPDGTPTLENRTLTLAAPLFTAALQTVGATASGGFAYLLVAGTDGGVGVLLMKPGCDP